LRPGCWLILSVHCGPSREETSFLQLEICHLDIAGPFWVSEVANTNSSLTIVLRELSLWSLS
jgi:hypothetical protein